MANYRTNKIAIGSNTYECAEWYGVCDTGAAARNKVVSISGFNSDSLVEGVKVTVRFRNMQLYDGIPTLNVSLTGAKNIVTGGVYAGYCEWNTNQVLTFLYNGTYWAIEDGTHADLSNYGKTRLTNTISNDSTMALTPKAVYDAGFLTLADLPVWDGSVT